MSEVSNGTGIREHLLLFSRFLRNPRTVGALSPSSRALAYDIVNSLDLSGSARVVELGPGTGALTGAIVERIGPEGRFFAVDIEPAFVRQIRLRWPDIECVCASAEHLESLLRARDLLPVDHIISGLPFASLPPPMTSRILDGIAKSLRAGGTFTTFQYVHAYGLPAAISFRRKMNAKMRTSPSRSLVIRNVPPAWVLTWHKKDLPRSS
jgi:phospholipid N-methyltransferase